MRGDERDLLVQIARYFGQTRDLNQLLPLVIRKVVDVLGAERGVIALCDADLRFTQVVSHQMDWDGGAQPLPISSHFTRRVLSERKLVVVSDAHTNSEFKLRDSVRALQLRFMMGAPIISRDRLLGLLYVDSKLYKSRELFRESEFFVSLSGLVATAVENAQLFTQLANHGRLIASLVHDLRLPLQIVQANAELLQLDQPCRSLDEILSAAHRLEAMISNTLERTKDRQSREEDELASLELGEELERILNQLRPLFESRALRLRLDLIEESPALRASRKSIQMILENLLFNALRYSPPNGEVLISTRIVDAAAPEGLERRRADELVFFRDVFEPEEGARFLEVSISNAGRISSALIARLFSPYAAEGDQLEDPSQSTGLGLYIVDQAVRHLGGRIWLAPEGAPGRVEFRFTVPLAR